MQRGLQPPVVVLVEKALRFGNIDPNAPPSLAAMFDTHSLMSVSTVSGRREKKSDFFLFFLKGEYRLEGKKKMIV